jgi:hypothetical protein
MSLRVRPKNRPISFSRRRSSSYTACAHTYAQTYRLGHTHAIIHECRHKHVCTDSHAPSNRPEPRRTSGVGNCEMMAAAVCRVRKYGLVTNVRMPSRFSPMRISLRWHDPCEKKWHNNTNFDVLISFGQALKSDVPCKTNVIGWMRCQVCPGLLGLPATAIGQWHVVVADPVVCSWTFEA